MGAPANQCNGRCPLNRQIPSEAWRLTPHAAILHTQKHKTHMQTHKRTQKTHKHVHSYSKPIYCTYMYSACTNGNTYHLSSRCWYTSGVQETLLEYWKGYTVSFTSPLGWLTFALLNNLTRVGDMMSCFLARVTATYKRLSSSCEILSGEKCHSHIQLFSLTMPII